MIFKHHVNVSAFQFPKHNSKLYFGGLRRLQNVLNCVHHPHSPGTLLSFFAGILLQNHKGYDESMYVVAFEVSDTLFTQNLSSVSSSF